MSLNWREIDLVLSELALAGCHIQRIVQPDFSSLVLGLYRPADPFALLVSLAPGKTRLHRLGADIAEPEKLRRFAQFLRSRVKGGKIVEARQLGAERIILLRVVHGEVATRLWIRLWSGAANVVATDDEGVILDAFYRRPARGEVTGGRFDPEGLASLARKPEKAYEVRDLPGAGSFNERVERAYGRLGGHGDVETLKASVVELLAERERRVRSTLAELEGKLSEYEHYEELRTLGDLVMSNLPSVRPGDRWLSAESFAANGGRIEIPLKEQLSARENAALYYERYKKAKSGLANVREEIAEHGKLLEAIARDRESVAAIEDPRKLAAYARRLEKQQTQRKASASRETRPGLEYRSGAYTILVGRSATENDALLRRHVKGNDYWLHSRDYPGAYVFVKSIAAKSLPLEVLLDAANLALYYSKAKAGGRADLYYTQVKHLRRPREGRLGLVLPTHEKNLSVALDEKRLDRLFNVRDSLLGTLG